MAASGIKPASTFAVATNGGSVGSMRDSPSNAAAVHVERSTEVTRKNMYAYTSTACGATLLCSITLVL